MTDQAELEVADLHYLEELYEEHSAASDEFEAEKANMTSANREYALESLSAKARAIESFEADHPKAANAFWGDE